MSETLFAYGWVESVNDGYAFIRTQRESGCGGCAATDTCGTSVLQKMFTAPAELKVVNHLITRPGDEVELALEGQDLVQQALMAYGLPLLGLFAGALMVMWLTGSGSDLAAISGAVIGLVMAWLAVKQFYHPTQPTLVRIVKRGDV